MNKKNKEEKTEKTIPEMSEKPEAVPSQREKSKMRQIVIETDGNNVKIVKADIAGGLELMAILNIILEDIKLKIK